MKKVKNYEEFLKLCQQINNQEFVNKEIDINISQQKNNLTTNYLLSAIGIPTSITTFNKLKEIGFINLYLHFKNIEIEYCLHLLFNPAKSKIKEFNQIEIQLQNIPNYVKLTQLTKIVLLLL